MSDPTDEACRAVYEARFEPNEDAIDVLRRVTKILGMDDLVDLPTDRTEVIRKLRDLRVFLRVPQCESIIEYAHKYVRIREHTMNAKDDDE